MSRLDGKELLGVVVDYDDPQQLGRVRVGIPSVMGNKVAKELLPWLSIASPGNGGSDQTFGRPPQPGSFLSVFFPHGSGSVNGIVHGLINGERNGESGGGLDLSGAIGWFSDALSFKPEVMAPPNTKQVSETNSSGVEKIVTVVEEVGNVLSMKDRKGLPTNLVGPLFSPVYDVISSVASGADDFISSFQAGFSGMIPGEIMNLGSITGISAITGSSPLSGTNFLSLGNRMAPGAAEAISAVVEGAENFSDLSQRITNIINNPAILGLDTIFPLNIDIQIPGMGSIGMSIGSDGSLSVDIPSEVKDALESFTSGLGGVIGGIGSLLDGSSIPNTIGRLPMEAQSKLREVTGSVSGKLGGVLGKSKAFL